MNFVRATILVAMVFFSTTTAQRIRVEGNKFFVGDNPIFMLGANTPWDNWNDFGHNFNSTWWNSHFEAMHNSGINCTRVWISCNGDNSSPGIDATGQVQEPTSQFWTHVESLFQIAQTNQIYLMIALVSFDHSKEGNNNANLWRAMYSDAQNRQSFVDNYAIPFVERFGSNPYFWSIDVGNELDWVHENDGVAVSDLFDLVARVANGVHANSEVLVTLGTGAGPKYLSPTYGTNYYSDTELQKLQPGAYLDFYNDHYYDWMKEWFSIPFDHSPSDWQIDEKPCVIGEYAALGHGSGYTPAECLQKAYALGWQGVMPWTSNGVDVNGSLSDFGSAFKTWSDANSNLVFPPTTENPGPFTLTVTQPQGGTIEVSPIKDQYTKGEEVILTAVAGQGNELSKWTGDASGTTESVTLTMTRNMTVSATFSTAGEFIQNGTFDNGTTFWTLGQYEGAVATASVADGQYQASISSGGAESWHVQVIQASLELVADRAYAFSFDASATSARSIFVAIGEASGTYDKYFQQNVDLTNSIQNFSFEFTPSASTSNARVEFNMGDSTGGITLDNISLKFADAITARHQIRPPSGQKADVFYNAVNSTLQIKNNSDQYMFVEGFAPDGRRIFSWSGKTANGLTTVPLSINAPQMMIVRGKTGDKIQFTQKVIRE